jgi:hypothetical protein
MTPTTIAGRPNDFADATAPPPTWLDTALDAGSFPARATVEGFDKAGQSVADAAMDPSLANLTAAGINTGAAIAPFSPFAGTRLIGGSAIGGLGLDALSNLISSPVDARSKAKSRPLPTAARAPAPPPMPSLEDDPTYQKVKDDPELVGLYTQIKQAQVDAVRDYPGRNGDESRRTASARLEKLQGDFTKALGARTAGQKQIFDQKVANANAAREQAMAQDDKFSDTFAGKVYKKTGIGPFIAAAIPSSIISLAKGPARDLPTAITRGLVSTGAGAVAANAPPAYDMMFAPAANPEKDAMRRYAFELPDGHPDKVPAAKYAEGLPDRNPTQSIAESELTPANIGKKAILGGVEGFLGGEVGDNLFPALGGFGRRASYGFKPRGAPGAAPAIKTDGAFSKGPDIEALSKSAGMDTGPAFDATASPTDLMSTVAAAKAPKIRGGVSAAALTPRASNVKALVDKHMQAQTVEDVMAGLPKGSRISKRDVQTFVKKNPDMTHADVLQLMSKTTGRLAKRPFSYSDALDAEK